MRHHATIEQYRLLIELAARFPERATAPAPMKTLIASLLQSLELPDADYRSSAVEAAFAAFLKRCDEQVAANLHQVRIELRGCRQANRSGACGGAHGS